jgi:DNA-binding transcriptional ArsR family regulator
MLLSKAHLYEEADQITSFYARAFTHPARLKILRSLRKNSPKTVQQLAIEHPLTLAAISQHLEMLRDAGFISFTCAYPFLLYSFEEEVYNEAIEYLFQFLREE